MYDELAAAQQRVAHAVQQVRARGRRDDEGGGSDLIQWAKGGNGRARYSKGDGGSGRPTQPTGELYTKANKLHEHSITKPMRDGSTGCGPSSRAGSPIRRR